MIHVSSEFKEIMMQRQDFKENAEVTFSDGTVDVYKRQGLAGRAE